jgi:hypothetical protein
VKHPAEMAEPEINAFLTHLAIKVKVSASTQNQIIIDDPSGNPIELFQPGR